MSEAQFVGMQRGRNLLNDPTINKGTAFTRAGLISPTPFHTLFLRYFLSDATYNILSAIEGSATSL